MASNYNLVSNAVFSPLSYERYMQPVMQYMQVRDAMEEKYSAMLDEALRYEAMKDTIDNDSYLKYKEFKDVVDAGIENISSGNLAPLDRAKLLEARRNYAKIIKPLNEQYVKREKEAQLAYEAKLKNPYISLSRDPRETPLSQYSNGMPDIQVLDGTQVMAMAQQVGKQLATQLTSDPSQLKPGGLAYQYIVNTGYGARPEQILALLKQDAEAGDDVASQYLTQMRDQIVGATGVMDWQDGKYKNQAISRATQFANIGLTSAIGQSGVERIQDAHGAQVDMFNRQVKEKEKDRDLKLELAGYKKDNDGKWVKEDGFGDVIELPGTLANGTKYTRIVRNKGKGTKGWTFYDGDKPVGIGTDSDVSKIFNKSTGSKGSSSATVSKKPFYVNGEGMKIDKKDYKGDKIVCTYNDAPEEVQSIVKRAVGEANVYGYRIEYNGKGGKDLHIRLAPLTSTKTTESVEYPPALDTAHETSASSAEDENDDDDDY